MIQFQNSTPCGPPPLFQVLPRGEALSGAGPTPLLHFDDLERIAPDDLARVCEWLTEKVDSLCAQLKPDSQEVRESCWERPHMGPHLGPHLGPHTPIRSCL